MNIAPPSVLQGAEWPDIVSLDVTAPRGMPSRDTVSAAKADPEGADRTAGGQVLRKAASPSPKAGFAVYQADNTDMARMKRVAGHKTCPCQEVHVKSLDPVNVTLFGRRVFAGMIKYPECSYKRQAEGQ